MSPDVREAAILANVGLVYREAASFRAPGRSTEDLAGWGVLGLIAAVDTFDASRNVKFSTHAAHRIRGAIRHALTAAERPIRLPNHVSRLAYLYARARAAMLAEGRDAPTFGEVCDRVEAEHGGRDATLRREAARPRVSRRGWRADLADGLRASRLATASGVARRRAAEVAAESEGHGDPYLANAVPDPSGPPDAAAERADELAWLRRRLASLDRRSRAVLTLHYGLDGRGERTQAQVAAAIGMTRESVRRIRARALATLAGPA